MFRTLFAGVALVCLAGITLQADAKDAKVRASSSGSTANQANPAVAPVASQEAAQKRTDEQAQAKKRGEEDARAEAAVRKAEEIAEAARDAKRLAQFAAPTGCIIKPVMTDADIALCR